MHRRYRKDHHVPCALAPTTSDGLTRALETAVFLEMRRRASSRVGSIALLKLKFGKEIDFIEGDEAFEIAYELIQVSLNMENEATRQREVSALQEAMARFEKDAATIVTLEEESSINIPEGVIHVMPAWKWLLGGKQFDRRSLI